MADILADGTTRIVWCTSISNLSAPTTTEIGAGVDLTTWITPDGWSVQTQTAKVDNSSLASVDNTSQAGRRDDDISVTFKSQGDANAPWTTFAGRPTGYLVERVGTAYGTAFATGQKLRVFPVQAGDRQRVPAAPNELVKFIVPFIKNAAVVDQATVA